MNPSIILQLLHSKLDTDFLASENCNSFDQREGGREGGSRGSERVFIKYHLVVSTGENTGLEKQEFAHSLTGVRVTLYSNPNSKPQNFVGSLQKLTQAS